MNDAGAMSTVEPVGDLDGDGDRLVNGEARRATQPIRQRLAVEMLEHQVLVVVMPADVVNGADVWVVQGGDGACFLLEALP